MKLRFVKFFKSRENEIEKKEEEGGEALPSRAPPPPSQLAAISPRSRSPLLPSSFPFSLPPPSSTSPHRPAPACRPPRVGRAIFSSYLLPSCSTSPFLLHKITEATERGGCHVAKHPACRPSLPIQLQRAGAQLAAPAPSRQLACPPPPPLSPISRCGPSTAIGAIGKQSMKMNYPVSSPSLMNK